MSRPFRNTQPRFALPPVLNGVQRKRSLNFSSEEKIVLLHLIKMSLNIIENRRSEFDVHEKKRNAWQNIVDRLNANFDNNTRDIRQVKEFWKRIKLLARRKVEDDKQQQIDGCEIEAQPTDASLQFVINMLPEILEITQRSVQIDIGHDGANTDDHKLINNKYAVGLNCKIQNLIQYEEEDCVLTISSSDEEEDGTTSLHINSSGITVTPSVSEFLPTEHDATNHNSDSATFSHALKCQQNEVLEKHEHPLGMCPEVEDTMLRIALKEHNTKMKLLQMKMETERLKQFHLQLQIEKLQGVTVPTDDS